MKQKKNSSEDDSLFNQSSELLKEDSKSSPFSTKLIGIRMALKGSPVSFIANILNVGVTTVKRWISLAKDKGLLALKRKVGSGKVPVLTDYEKEQIEIALSNPPEDSGFRIWEGKTLSLYIYREFDKVLGVRACQKLLHELGFSYTKPRSAPAPLKPNEEARNAFVLLMQGVTSNPLLILVFEDEVHFLVQAKVGKMWQKIGSRNTVRSKPGRDKVSYMGFLIAETGQVYTDAPEHFTYETMITGLEDFLRDCPPPEGKKYCIVFDNAPWHAKMNRLIWKEKLPEYEHIRKFIEPVFLPPYSPDLNPIEILWRITRREVTNNREFTSKEELSHALDSYFEEYSQPNEKFKTLLFRKYTQGNDNQKESQSKTEDSVSKEDQGSKK